MQALDSILAVVPTIKALRDVMASTLSTTPVADVHEVYKPTFVNPTATRPAASAARAMELLALHEAEESPYRLASPARARGSPSTRRLLFAAASGSGSGSPSPKRNFTARKNRKRRESGILLPIRGQGDDDDSPVSDSGSQWEDADEDVVEESIAVEDVPVPVEETTKKQALKEKETEKEKVVVDRQRSVSPPTQSSASAPTDQPPRILPPSRLPVKRASLPPPPIDDDTNDDAYSTTSTTSTLSPPPPSPPRTQTQTAEALLPALQFTEATEATPAPEEGRTARRARGSVVSYKEPSLRTKMRKPDGTEMDDVLGVINRAEPAVTGVRRKSALPRSTARLVIEPLDEAPRKQSSTSGSVPASSAPAAARAARRISPPGDGSRAVLADLDTYGNVSRKQVSSAPAATSDRRRQSAAV